MKFVKKIGFVLMLLLLVSCDTAGKEQETPENPEEKPTLKVTPSEQKVGEEGGVFKVTVDTNSDWTVKTDAEWTSVNATGGTKGTTQVDVTVEPNTKKSVRQAHVVFKVGSKSVFTLITQSGVAQIDLSATQVAADASECTKVVMVKTNGDWTITGGNEWCSVSPQSGSAGTTAVTVSCKENKDYAARKAAFSVSSGLAKADIEVTQDAAIKVPEGYGLVWSQEFNELPTTGRAALPDTKMWFYETGAGGWGNNEIQKYVAGVSGTDTVARIENGVMKIIAQKVGGEVLSARINSIESWTYGYFEARLKLPTGRGTWPAFWMMPKNFTAWPYDGEIDIMEEVGYNPNYVSSSIHCQAYYHSIGTQKTKERYLEGAQTEFHVYALEWTEDFIRTYVDGEQLFEFQNDGKGDKNTWPFNAPFYLKLNLAWGGNWGGYMGVDESCLPATYEIDYVRVFKKK